MVLAINGTSAVSHATNNGASETLIIHIIAVIAIVIVFYFILRLVFNYLSKEKPIKQKDVFKQVNSQLNLDMLFNNVNKKSYLNFSNGVKVKVLSHGIDSLKSEKQSNPKVLKDGEMAGSEAENTNVQDGAISDTRQFDVFKVRISIKKFKRFDAFVFLGHEWISKIGNDYVALIDNIGFKSLGNLIIQNDILTDVNNYIKNVYIFRNDYTTILNEYENANLKRAVVSDIETAKSIKIDKEHLELFTKLLNDKNYQRINSMINK